MQSCEVSAIINECLQNDLVGLSRTISLPYAAVPRLPTVVTIPASRFPSSISPRQS